MKYIRYLVLGVSFLVILIGCGGGGSSSSGGPGSQFAGTYTGSGKATVTVGNSSSQTPTYGVTIRIRDDGRVTVTDSDGVGEGRLSGNRFTASYDLPPISAPGGNCPPIPINYNGVVNGTVINGNIVGNGTCTIVGNKVAATIRGSFNANKSSSGKMPIKDSSILTTIRDISSLQ